MRPILIVLSLIAALYFALGQLSDNHQLLRERSIIPREPLPISLSNDNWLRQHPVESGWMLTAISVVDSMHAWACGWHDSAAGLVVRTTDGGNNWTEMSRTLPIFVNDIHFVNDTLGWVVGGGAFSPYTGFIHHTTDGGQSWATQLTDSHNRFWSVFFLDDMRGWVCGDSGKILATTNGGIDWQLQASGRHTLFEDIFFFPNGTGWCSGFVLLKTTNFGAQWDSIFDERLSRISFLNDSSGWAVGDSRYWKTTNGGRMWSYSFFPFSSIAATDVIMLNDSLVLSTILDNRVDPPFDYFPITLVNLTWLLPPIETRARPPLFGIDFTKTGHGFAVGLKEIVGSRDSGRTWTNQAGTLPWSLLAIDMVDSSIGWVVGDKELIMRTTDGGRHWKPQSPAGGGTFWTVASIDREHAFVGGSASNFGGSAFMATTNGGVTWVRTGTPGDQPITGLSFLDTMNGWAATESNTVFHTTDRGENWTPQSVSSGSVRLHAVDFVDSNYGWCSGTSGLIYGTTNGGLTWTTQAVGRVGIFSSIDFVDRDIGWVAGEHLILKTTNGGAQWDTSIVTPLAGYRGVHFVNRDTGWAVGEKGRIIASTNGGVTWIVQRPGGNPGERALYSVDAVSSNLVWISGQAGEILHTGNGGGITFVRTVVTGMPERLELEQNYPNPFNATTKIRFGIPSRGLVSLCVYDILGREVATLVDEVRDGGTYDEVFDASNIASGIYIYRLSAGSLSASKKLVLLK